MLDKRERLKRGVARTYSRKYRGGTHTQVSTQESQGVTGDHKWGEGETQATANRPDVQPQATQDTDRNTQARDSEPHNDESDALSSGEFHTHGTYSNRQMRKMCDFIEAHLIQLSLIKKHPEHRDKLVINNLFRQMAEDAVLGAANWEKASAFYWSQRTNYGKLREKHLGTECEPWDENPNIAPAARWTLGNMAFLSKHIEVRKGKLPSKAHTELGNKRIIIHHLMKRTTPIHLGT